MDKRYAPIGLIVAALATVAAFSIYFVQREWNLPVQISLTLVIIGLATFVLLDPNRARNMLSGRQARYGSNAFVLALAFTGIVIVINVLIYQNATTWKLRWDWTENKENTLAPETIEILEAMPEKVLARAYYGSQNVSGQENAKDLLEDFKFYGSDTFDYEFVNPDENPVAALQDGYSRDGVILIMGDNKEILPSVTELEMASGLVRLLNPEKQKIYFLVAHGEFTFEETGDASLTQFKSALTDRNYIPETLNLLALGAIPEDAKLIIIPGPLTPLSANEVNLLSAYLDGGGSLMVLYEPVALTQFGNDPDPLTSYLQDSWGITMQNDIIVDPQAIQFFGGIVTVSNQFAKHVITDKLTSSVSVFPTARSVRNGDTVDGITKTELVLTAPQSWAETNIASINSGEIAPDEGEDLFGPVPVAVVANNTLTGAKLLVVGDAEFVTNQAYTAYGNADLILNAVNWAIGQENIINLTPKTVTQRTLQLPPQGYILNLILFAVVLVLPGLVLLSGIVVWIQRRRRA